MIVHAPILYPSWVPHQGWNRARCAFCGGDRTNSHGAPAVTVVEAPRRHVTALPCRACHARLTAGLS